MPDAVRSEGHPWIDHRCLRRVRPLWAGAGFSSGRVVACVRHDRLALVWWDRRFKLTPRVAGTLLGSVLFLGSHWLRLGAELELRGWQAAAYAVEMASHGGYLTSGMEMRICLLMICAVNVAAIIVPPMVIAKPRDVSLLLTVTIAVLNLAPWSLLLRADTLGILERPFA